MKRPSAAMLIQSSKERLAAAFAGHGVGANWFQVATERKTRLWNTAALHPATTMRTILARKTELNQSATGSAANRSAPEIPTTTSPTCDHGRRWRAASTTGRRGVKPKGRRSNLAAA